MWALQPLPPCTNSHSGLSVPSFVPVPRTLPIHSHPCTLAYLIPGSSHPLPLFCIQASEKELSGEDETQSFWALAGPQERNSAVQLLLRAGGGALKLPPPPLETLLSCQQPRRRPHLEASRRMPAEAIWSSTHLDFSPAPPGPGSPTPLTSIPVGSAILPLRARLG